MKTRDYWIDWKVKKKKSLFDDAIKVVKKFKSAKKSK